MTVKTLLLFCLLCLSWMQSSFADPIANQHAPAGVMFDHIHEKGEWMLGYNVQRLYQNQAYYHASQTASAEQLAPYSMLAQQHEMYMQMFHIMYAPTDNLSLSLMPMYMRMDMPMIPNTNLQNSDHTEHAMSHAVAGQSNTHASTNEGWGDTLINASYRLLKQDRHQLITSLALSAPTGDYKKFSEDQRPIHYGMQIGAGLWQAIPSLTYLYHRDLFSAGLQVSTRQPLFNDLNRLGYYVGDQHNATAWLSYLWHPYFNTSARIQYSRTDSIQGHYQTEHNHSTPADIQGNYGGEQSFAGLGFNAFLPWFGGLRTGLEIMTPIDEHLKGVQQRTAHIWNFSVSRGF